MRNTFFCSKKYAGIYGKQCYHGWIRFAKKDDMQFSVAERRWKKVWTVDEMSTRMNADHR